MSGMPDPEWTVCEELTYEDGSTVRITRPAELHFEFVPEEEGERVGEHNCLCRRPGGGIETRRRADNQNWHLVIDGERVGVSNKARSRIAEALDLTTVRQTLPPGIAWPEVDGEPVLPGDVLWDADGTWVEVGAVRIDRECIDDPQADICHGCLGATQVPAILVSKGAVRGGDCLHVTVELVRWGDDGYDAKP
ncbi:hypothetical protein AAK967_00050 [Atopobiaceae bacterium 24-176]